MRTRLHVPRPGNQAPDFTLPCTDGGEIRLALAPKPAVLVFLRHLA